MEKETMKIVIVLILAVAAAFFATRHFNTFEPPAAKAYRHVKRNLTKDEVENPKVSFVPYSSLVRWDLKVRDFKSEGDTAQFTAIERIVLLPENASTSHMIKAMSVYEVRMIKSENVWLLDAENLIDQKVENPNY